MAFCAKTDFVGDINLPSEFLNSTQFNAFLLKYEKQILVSLLGFDLYKSFIDGLNVTLPATPAQKWTDLKDGKIYSDYDSTNTLVRKEYSGIVSVLKYFMFFFMADYLNSTTSITGEINAKNENSELTSPTPKLVGIWNDSMDEVEKCKEFIEYSNEVDETTYPNFNFSTKFFQRINIFSI